MGYNLTGGNAYGAAGGFHTKVQQAVGMRIRKSSGTDEQITPVQYVQLGIPSTPRRPGSTTYTNPFFVIQRETNSPTNNDTLYHLFRAQNSAEENISIARWVYTMTDVTDGVETGRVGMAIKNEGSAVPETIFQVESDNFRIVDDKFISFGSDDDVTLGYDETTTDRLIMSHTSATDDAVVDLISLEMQTSGTLVDDFGLGLSVRIENDASEVEERASIDFPVTDVSNGAEDCDILFRQSIAGTVVDRLRIDADGPIEFISDDTVDGIVDLLALTHSSSDNNATVGDGAGLIFKLENATGTSTVEEWGSIDVLSTTIADGSEDGDMQFRIMIDGAVATKLLLNADGLSQLTGGIEIANTSAYGTSALLIDNDDTDQIALEFEAANIDADVMQVTADAVTTAYIMDVTADGLTSGGILNLVSDHDDATSRTLVQITNDHTGATGATPLAITQDSTGNALTINSGTDATASALQITNLAGGYGINVSRDLVATDSALVYINDDGASSVPALHIHTDAVAEANARALYIDADSMTNSTAVELTADGLVAGVGVDLTSSSTAFTANGRILRVNHTGTSTIAQGALVEFASAATEDTTIAQVTASGALAAGVALDVSAAAMTTGTAIDISNLDAITSGKAIHVDATGVTHNTGILVHIDSGSTALTGAGRLLSVSHTGVSSVSGIVAEVVTAAEDETVALQVAGTTTAQDTFMNLLRLKETTSHASHASAGLGASIEVHLENDAGTVEEHASVDFITTTVTDGSEDTDIVFSQFSGGGATPVETLRLDADLPGAALTSAQSTTQLRINNTAADGDPFLSWALSGTNQFSLGVDDTDDALRLGTTAIGTATIFEVPTGGGSYKVLVPTEIENPVAGGAAALLIDNNDTDEVALDIDADNIDTDVIDVAANALTTGTGISITSSSVGMTSGRMMDVIRNATGTIADKTTSFARVSDTILHSADTDITVNYDLLDLVRSNYRNTGGIDNHATTAAGSVLKLSNVISASSGTITDSVYLLEMNQDADSTGYAMFIAYNPTASVAVYIVGQNETADIMQINANQLISADVIDISMDKAAQTSARGLNIDSTIADIDANRTGSIAAIAASRTKASVGSGANSDDFDLLALTRTNAQSGGVYTASSGSVLNLTYVTSGTIGTNDVHLLEAVMPAGSTGNSINIDHNAAGNAVTIISGSDTAAATLDITNEAGGYGIDVSRDLAHGDTDSALVYINDDGDSDQYALHIHTDATSQAGARALFVDADSVTTQQAVELTADALTGGIGVNLTSSSTGITTNGRILRVNASGDFDDANGAAAEIASVHTTGVGLLLTMDAVTDGYGQFVTADALTSGVGVEIESSSTSLTTNGRLFKVDATGDFNDAGGNVVEIASVHTTGTGLQLTMDAVTDGYGGFMTADALTSGIGFEVESSSTNLTTNGRLFKVDATGDFDDTGGVAAEIASAHTTGEALRVTADAATDGFGMTLTADALTTGIGASLTSTSANITGAGRLLSVNAGGASAGTIAEITNAGTGSELLISNTNTGALGAVLKMSHLPGNSQAADDDVTNRIIFTAHDEEASATERTVGQLDIQWTDATAVSYASDLELYLATGAAQNMVLTCTGGGQLGVDLDSDITAAGTGADIFDDYDDAKVLKQYAYLGIDEPEVSIETIQMLEEMGIVEKSDKNKRGYMLKLQPFLRLVCGGIYQTRQAMEELAQRLFQVEQQMLPA